MSRDVRDCMPLKTVNAYWWDFRVPCLVLKKETMSTCRMEDPACIVHQVPEELRMRKDEVGKKGNTCSASGRNPQKVTR